MNFYLTPVGFPKGLIRYGFSKKYRSRMVGETAEESDRDENLPKTGRDSSLIRLYTISCVPKRSNAVASGLADNKEHLIVFQAKNLVPEDTKNHLMRLTE